MKKYTFKKYFFILIACLLFSCDEFVKIAPPRTDLVKKTVFDNDVTAEGAMTDIYFQLKNSGFAAGGSTSISLLGSLSSDESISYNASSPLDYDQFNKNTLQANNTILSSVWTGLYSVIYKSNAVIEGLNTSTGVTIDVKNRLVAEAKFIRAFCHFYLVNMWGDVPLIVSTDYQTNNKILRTPIAEVYNQIIDDLQNAQSALPDTYTISNNERVRANKGAATALLARVYLYTSNWVNAEIEASSIINNTSLYVLETDLSKVYRATGKEAILQLWSQQFPSDRSTFFVSSTGPRVSALHPEFAGAFEVGDLRWTVWGKSRVVNGITYYYTLKYFDFSSPPLDYSTVLRLAEQYLIRAEARAMQNKVTESASDLNVIRNRAGLASISVSTQQELLDAIMKERRAEFYTEWGHRWFDLKRTNRADAVLGPIKPEWGQHDVLYPIPEIQIINNPSITQNPN